ncbi:hypothetical protein SCAR479_12552 [Seiridium cardinale]|uniref:Uncharacterized protein n=1 Tax=Seiridium cardinale TaxID=138064 RepID=A0ABR2XAD6_9PEZI
MANMKLFYDIHSEDTLRLLYEPVVLVKALNDVYRSMPDGSGHSETMQPDSLITDEDCFHSFVNKLAQVCDSEHGGDTVTAAAVLEDADGPVIVLGSNKRGTEELKSMKAFVERLLNLISNSSDKMKKNEKKALTKRVLWMILEFGIKRVELYLRQLVYHVDECIKHCGTTKDCGLMLTGAQAAGLEEELEKLRILANFPRDIVTSSNSKDKCQYTASLHIILMVLTNEDNAVFSDCETLVKAILTNKVKGFDSILESLAMDKDSSISEPWRELRHYCGRLLSYRQAAETLITANERWPELFSDVKVVAIRSSTRIARPLCGDLTGFDVIKNMGPEGEESEQYLRQVEDLQKFRLDQHIQDLIAKPSFRPIVHAEMLIHSRLQHLPGSQDDLYWNGWKYIGSSKPTCRLCSYYFEAHDVTVRATHKNIYHNWRLPDLPQLASEGAVTEQRQLLAEVTQRVRDDIVQMLFEKRFIGKRHDTLTYSDPMYGGSDSSSVAQSDHVLSSFSTRDQTIHQPVKSLRAVTRPLNQDYGVANKKEYSSENDETDSSGAELRDSAALIGSNRTNNLNEVLRCPMLPVHSKSRTDYDETELRAGRNMKSLSLSEQIDISTNDWIYE